MSLFGSLGKFVGGSDKSQTQSSQSTSNVTNVGATSESGPALALSGSQISVELTDLGAVKSAFDFSGETAAAAFDTSERVVRSLGDVVDQYGSNVRGLSELSIDSNERLVGRVVDALGGFVDRQAANLNTFAAQSIKGEGERIGDFAQAEGERTATVIKWSIAAVVLLFGYRVYAMRGKA